MTNQLVTSRFAFPWAAVLCALLVGGVAIDRNFVKGHERNADGYHAAIFSAGQDIPRRVGMWYAAAPDPPITQAAVALLRPNLIVSRAYRNLQSGDHVTFLLVQCKDARDILGHYPPVCYVNQGWQLRQRTATEWTADGRILHGTEYRFVSSRMDRLGSIIVCNFMLLPNGNTCPDMDGVDLVARDRLRRFFGAAQIQLVFDSNTTPQQREEILKMLVHSYKPVIDRILGGVQS